MSRGAVVRFILVLGLLAGCAAIALGVKPNLGIHRSDRAMSGPVPRIYVMVDEPPAYLAKAQSMAKDDARIGANLALASAALEGCPMTPVSAPSRPEPARRVLWMRQKLSCL